MSKVNDDFARFLDSKGIAYKREFKIDNYYYDFKIGNKLIEINPTYTHNCGKNSIQNTFRNKKKKNPSGLNGIEQSYHRKKSICAIQHGYQCIHKFDWMTNEDVVKLILSDFKMIDAGTTIVFYDNKSNTKIDKEKYDMLTEEEKHKYSIFFTDGFDYVIE